jgi:protein JSN1
VLGSDVGAIRIGYARVPVKPSSSPGPEEPASVVSGVGDLSVGATIHALRGIKGATAVPADLQVLGGTVENFRSNLLLSMIANQNGTNLGVTEQQMVMMELSDGSKDAEADVQALAGELSFFSRAISVSDANYSRLPPSDNVLHHYPAGG